MRFCKLGIGDQFIFESEVSLPYSGMMRGPWIKISKREYCPIDDSDFVCTVRTINVEVIKQTVVAN